MLETTSDQITSRFLSPGMRFTRAFKRALNPASTLRVSSQTHFNHRTDLSWAISG